MRLQAALSLVGMTEFGHFRVSWHTIGTLDWVNSSSRLLKHQGICLRSQQMSLKPISRTFLVRRHSLTPPMTCVRIGNRLTNSRDLVATASSRCS